MSAALDDLINQPEPWPLAAFHCAKAVLVVLGLISIPVALVAAAFGFGTMWIYVSLALITAATLVALVANRWSENLFARRAEPLGLAPNEARTFWRTYDWDQADA